MPSGDILISSKCRALSITLPRDPLWWAKSPPNDIERLRYPPLYHDVIQSALETVLATIEPLVSDGVTLLGIIGISESPTCGTDGYFMKALRAHHLFSSCPYIEIPPYFDDEQDVFLETLRAWASIIVKDARPNIL